MKSLSNQQICGSLAVGVFSNADLVALGAPEYGLGSKIYNSDNNRPEYWDGTGYVPYSVTLALSSASESSWLSFNAQGELELVVPDAGVTPTMLSEAYYTEAEIDAAIATAKQEVKDELIDGAPGTFDTLKEIADELAADDAQATQIIADIASNDTDIAALQAQAHDSVTILAESFSGLTLNGQELSLDVSSLQNDIAANNAAIVSNDSDISQLQTDTVTNTNDITALETDVAANATTITTNTAAIATNATSIADNNALIDDERVRAAIAPPTADLSSLLDDRALSVPFLFHTNQVTTFTAQTGVIVSRENGQITPDSSTQSVVVPSGVQVFAWRFASGYSLTWQTSAENPTTSVTEDFVIADFAIDPTSASRYILTVTNALLSPASVKSTMLLDLSDNTQVQADIKIGAGQAFITVNAIPDNRFDGRFTAVIG